MHPTIIDRAEPEDAGFWKDALRFAPLRIEDFPCPALSIHAGHPGRRDARPPVNVPAVNSHSIHDERNATEVQQNPDAR